jgi:hypothetical protein
MLSQRAMSALVPFVATSRTFPIFKESISLAFAFEQHKMMLVLGIETGLGQSKWNPKLEPKTMRGITFEERKSSSFYNAIYLRTST